jgi:hypothetical protein
MPMNDATLRIAAAARGHLMMPSPQNGRSLGTRILGKSVLVEPGSTAAG